ncbi:MAG: outer membrane lipoprotein chaperone LolA [Gammaproteobacteria bacterium]|nr:outer membrane lipoprotein chaperone LolA [Gammaproteobacteria bacterium]
MKQTIIKSCLSCASMLILSLAVNAAADNPLEVFLDGLATFSADFEQVLLDSSGETLEVTRGALRLRRPGMFYWLYNEPYVQEIISDGSSLWVYEEDLEQVTVSDVSDAVEDTPALIFSGDNDPGEYYVIEELESGEGGTVVELTPKNPESYYRLLRLVFSGDELAGMALFDNLGQTLFISFTNAVRNLELKKELFTFSPTDETEVIDARQPH